MYQPMERLLGSKDYSYNSDVATVGHIVAMAFNGGRDLYQNLPANMLNDPFPLVGAGVGCLGK